MHKLAQLIEDAASVAKGKASVPQCAESDNADPIAVASPHQARTAFEVSSVPLSLTIIPGLPRSAIRSASSRTSLRPEIEVSGTARRHSRVTSSTTFSTRKRLPDAS